MKLLGNLLLVLGLILAMLSAATSYFVFVGEEGPVAEEPLRLKAPAGAVPPSEAALEELRARYEAGELTAEEYTAKRAAVEPVVDAEARLEGERVATLREASIDTVFVKSFAFGRWRFWWVFALGCVGLVTGSLLVRRAARREIEAVAAATPEAGAAESPEAALAGLEETVRGLRADLEGLGDDRARLEAILTRLGEAQRTHVAALVRARTLLVARKGLGGYAELMDHFAAAERQINRAWSAAADGALEESLVCLENAEELVGETRRVL